MKGKVVKAVLIIIILVLGIIQIVPECVEAAGVPKISIIFDESILAFDVRPGSDCTEIITGRVISDEPARDVRVILQAYTDQNWMCTVDPTEIIVPPRSEAPFSIEIVAPPETSFYKPCTLYVEGTAGLYPGSSMYSIAPITGSLRVRQYSKFTMGCSKPIIETQPGAKEIFEVSIINMGNARESYNLEIVNIDNLDQDGFTVTISNSKIEVDEKDNATFQVKVTVPTGMDGMGTHNIEIQVKPEDMEVDDAQAQTFTLTAKVSEDKIVFTTEFQIIILIVLIAIVVSILFIKFRRKKLKLKQSN
jgi:hypothetical protein